MRKNKLYCSFFGCEKQKLKVKWRFKTKFNIYILMKIADLLVHKIISDDFFYKFKFDKVTLICTDL
jgi:hypothetical protein